MEGSTRLTSFLRFRVGEPALAIPAARHRRAPEDALQPIARRLVKVAPAAARAAVESVRIEIACSPGRGRLILARARRRRVTRQRHAARPLKHTFRQQPPAPASRALSQAIAEGAGQLISQSAADRFGFGRAAFAARCWHSVNRQNSGFARFAQPLSAF